MDRSQHTADSTFHQTARAQRSDVSLFCGARGLIARDWVVSLLQSSLEWNANKIKKVASTQDDCGVKGSVTDDSQCLGHSTETAIVELTRIRRILLARE